MAQNRWVNITIDPNVAVKSDRQNDNHGAGLGTAAASDMTLSYDTAKFTSLNVLRSACNAALVIAAQSMKP
jgi:hypothetical protein